MSLSRCSRCLIFGRHYSVKGPLPTDPLAPPPKPPGPPPPVIEPGQKSAIFNDNYLRRQRFEKGEAGDVSLNPYALMASSYPRLCAVSRAHLPKSFMLKLKPVIMDDEGTLALFPDEVQSRKYVPPKSGLSLYCALTETAVTALTNRKGVHVWFLKNVEPAARVPANLPAIVEDMLGKRVVQELEIARRVIRAIPKEFAASPFFRPLSPAQEKDLLNDTLPTYPDAKVIAVLGTSLREPCEPTLLGDPESPDVPIFPLKLASHSAQATALLRELVSLERRRGTEEDVSAAAATVDELVGERAAAEGVSKYVAGSETVAELGGKLPQAEIDAATTNVEAHMADEQANFVAVVVPNDHVPHQWRGVAVPLVVAILRVGLFNGIGWIEEPVPAEEEE